MRKQDDISLGDMKTEIAEENSGAELELSLGDQPTMDETGFQPLGKVDRYQIVKELGAGGFGTVFLAKDTEAGTLVALKALPPEISAIPEELDNVRNNFAFVSKLLHQNIAGLLYLHKVDECDAAAEQLLRISNRSYLVVMEYVQGTTLSVWKKQYPDRKVPLDKALDICAKAAEALDYAHSRNIIHRDVKPANIMIGTDNSVKVMDFGLAAEVRSSMSRVSQEKFDTSGTRPYMAPEQWAGEKQSAPTDQYSLAVMFYELISGEVPFQSAFETGDAILMMNLVRSEPVKPLPELTKKQNAALLRGLSKNPEERFASCGDFIRALSGGKTGSLRSPNANGKSANPLKKLAVLFMLLVIIGGVSWYGVNVYHEQVKAEEELKRITKLNEAKRKEIAAALRQAESLYNDGKYSEASNALQKVFDLDRDNANAKVLQDKLALAAGLADVSPIRSEAEVLWEKTQTIKMTDGFEKDLDKLKIDIKTADTLFNKEDYGSALKCYQGVISQCKVLRNLDQERNAAKAAANDCATAKRSADKAEASRDAQHIYTQAEKSVADANKAMTQRDYQGARKYHVSATEQYNNAQTFAVEYRKVVALKDQLDRLKQSALSASDMALYGGIGWVKIKTSILKADNSLKQKNLATAHREYQAAIANLPQVIADAKNTKEATRKRKLKAQYDAYMSAGKLAFKRRDWTEAETAFKKARQVEGYSYDNAAHDGIKTARGGAELVRKRAAARTAYETVLTKATELYNASKRLGKTDTQAHEKCAETVKTLETFVSSSHYAYTDSDAKAKISNLKNQAESYLKTLIPPSPDDLKAVPYARYASLSGLTSGSREAQERQKQWVSKLGLPLEVATRKVGIKLRLIPPGSFTMGYNRRVTLTKPFYCGMYEVTQGQWKRVMGSNPSYFKNAGDDAPVECVSWDDCQKFLKKLCELEGVPQGTYRLLTEAEWEYACRAGTTTAFCYGDSLNSSQANFDRNKTIEVGSYKTNAFGLYDMHGNVWEWCSDWYSSLSDGKSIDPTGSLSGLNKVYRGGCWDRKAETCCSAGRHGGVPNGRYDRLGFRLMREVNKNKK